jgi:LysR family hydrogen peroxide-inducible transcriptional activator
MISLPTLRQMQYLIALSAHQTFVRAAEECNVTQSTLSSGIQDMEDILGVILIDRQNRRNVRFTPAGEETIIACKEILRKAETLAYRLGQQKNAWPLRLGVILTIAPYLLPKILKPLRSSVPGLTLHIKEAVSAQIVESLHTGNLDLALMAFPYETRGLEEHIVYREKFLCAGPKGFFKDREMLRMDDLQNQNLLLLEEGHCLRDHALNACKSLSFTQEKQVRAENLSTLIQFVREGYGITLLPEMATGKDALLPKGVEIKPFIKDGPFRQIGFAYKKNVLRENEIKVAVQKMATIVLQIKNVSL